MCAREKKTQHNVCSIVEVRVFNDNDAPPLTTSSAHLVHHMPILQWVRVFDDDNDQPHTMIIMIHDMDIRQMQTIIITMTIAKHTRIQTDTNNDFDKLKILMTWVTNIKWTWTFVCYNRCTAVPSLETNYHPATHFSYRVIFA